MANANRSDAAAPRHIAAADSGTKISPVLGALHEVHGAHNRCHAELERLEQALEAVLAPAPPSNAESSSELSHSALHGELLTARDHAIGFEAKVINLINRLTL